MTVALQDLLRSSVHRVAVGQVKGHGGGSVCLLLEQNKAVSSGSIFFVILIEMRNILSCSRPFYIYVNVFIVRTFCVALAEVAVSSWTTCCRRVASRPHSTRRAPAVWKARAHSATQKTPLVSVFYIQNTSAHTHTHRKG